MSTRGEDQDITWGDNVIYADFSGRAGRNGTGARKGQKRASVRSHKVAFRSPVAQALYDGVVKHADEGRRRRGEKYFADGHVLGATMSDKVIVGEVEGTQLDPFTVVIRLPHRDTSDVTQLLTWMVDNPSTIEDSKRGVLPESKIAELLSDEDEQIVCQCTCPDHTAVCKHAIAVVAYAARDVDDEPLRVFELRGLRESDFQSNLQRLLREKAARQRQKVETARSKLMAPPRIQFGQQPVRIVESDFWGKDLPRVELPQPEPINVLKETDQVLLHEALRPTCVLPRETLRAVSDLEECWDHLQSCQELADREGPTQ
ncbi:hypothetical protein [Corynebacterium sp. H78]|uniref:hypothetical protein n=1 Tax=Corynebacterium sp. H78 TaxID=3133417 RepID=UPI0030A8FBD7